MATNFSLHMYTDQKFKKGDKNCKQNIRTHHVWTTLSQTKQLYCKMHCCELKTSDSGKAGFSQQNIDVCDALDKPKINK